MRSSHRKATIVIFAAAFLLNAGCSLNGVWASLIQLTANTVIETVAETATLTILGASVEGE